MNRKINTRFFVALLLPLIFTLSFSGTARTATEDSVTIVFTSGMAEIYLEEDRGGHAHLQTFLKTVRKAEDEVLFIHGGDSLSPGILSTIDQGGHIISILNRLRPDLMAVSKSDLAHQEDALSLRSFEAAFPFINCNLYDPLTGSQPEGILPSFIKTFGELKLGFLSVVDPEVITDYMPERVSTIEMNKAVAKNSQMLRERGADIVILVAGFTQDKFNSYLLDPPVDLVLLSTTTGEPGLKQQGNSLFALTGNEGMAALISLELNRSSTPISWTGIGKAIRLIDYTPDAELEEQISSYLSQLSEVLSRTIATTTVDFETRRELMRTGENGFANLAADALRKHYNSDVAIINGGGFRANRHYAAGSTITVGDIQKELPFNNRVVNIRVKGRILRKTLERGLSRIEEQKGCFPHISGMLITYNPKRPPMQRVVSVMVGGKELEPEKIYTLTTIDFMANGGDGFLELKDAERVVQLGETRLLWEYIHNHIASLGVISPKTDGRMTAVTD